MSVLGEVRAATASHSGPLVAIALALAGRLDDAEESSPAPVAKELRATLAAIAEQKPAEVNPLDDIERKREERRNRAGAKGSRATGSQSS